MPEFIYNTGRRIQWAAGTVLVTLSKYPRVAGVLAAIGFAALSIALWEAFWWAAR